MTLNSSQIYEWMLTWIVVDDLLKNWTASTENNLVSFELSLIITDQGHIRMFILRGCTSRKESGARLYADTGPKTWV